MPKQLNNGRITQALQSAFGFKGRYIPLLDEVIVPVYAISDPVPAEPQSTFGRRIFAPAVGANFSTTKFTNPLGSGVLALVTSVSAASFVSAPGPSVDVIGVTLIISDDSPLGSSDGLSAIARDTRVSSGSSKVVFSFSSTSLDVNTLSAMATLLLVTDLETAQVVGGTGQAQDRLPPLVIRPGRGFQLITSGSEANDAGGAPLLMNVAWTEVPEGGPATPRGI